MASRGALTPTRFMFLEEHNMLNTTTGGNSPEVWVPIAGYEGLYEVSDLGRVRSLDREVATLGPRNRTSKRLRGKLLSQTLNKGTGYLSVSLSRDGRVRRKDTHTLVARAFCDGEMPGMEVNHDDGVKGNNRADNLEWVTSSRNNEHAYFIGLRPTGKAHHFSKLKRDSKGRCLPA